MEGNVENTDAKEGNEKTQERKGKEEEDRKGRERGISRQV